MAGLKKHYEIQGLKSGSWTVQKVYDDRSAAIDAAKTLFRDLALKAVKVLEVSFGDTEVGFQDKEVYFEGERPAKASGDSSVELIRPVCRNIEDMRTLMARRSIAVLLAKPLQGWQIMPVELLYHQGHLRRLSDTGQVLQGAVQKVAISQIQKTGQKVNERVLELYTLVNERLQGLKEDGIEGNVPDFDGQDLLGLYRASQKHDNWQRMFLMALARHFQGLKTTDEKFAQILDYIGQYDEPGIVQILDMYLADFLTLSRHLKQLLGDENNLGDAVLSLVDLIRGNKETATVHARHVDRLCVLMRDQLLPQTRETLIQRVREILQGNKSFVAGDLLESARYHSLILTRIRIGQDEHIGGREAIEALQYRCERLMGSMTIARMLEGADLPLDKVDRLLKINKGVIGASNKRAIANYILPVLQSDYNIREILAEGRVPLALVNRLRGLQKQVLKANFQEFHETRILEALDQIALTALAEADLLSVLEKRAATEVHLGLSLLELIVGDRLTRPEAEKQVRDKARMTIKAPTFLPTLQGMADKGQAPPDFLKQFYNLLKVAGIQ
ncbi:hypothetical protein [Sneathiella chinensis]|uniref:Uncharacterized protein n=1 Tax=Sneathiella chinensis TaxID=349750 RepID=A0ABQ5U2K7_9PROT|nr:hypothetical protein [Sneathiella chinensis]GLQ06322.1 hypothetical protein GCM10007924_15430 [Sneathiella chinensis]